MFCPGEKSMGRSTFEQKISWVMSAPGDSQPPSISQKRPSSVLQTLKRNISPQSSFSIISLSWYIHKRTRHPQMAWKALVMMSDSQNVLDELSALISLD